MHRLSNTPQDSFHDDILRDNIADAQEHPSYGNWAGGIVKQYRSQHGLGGFVFWHNRPALPWMLQHWRVSFARFGMICMCPKNSPLQRGRALHTVGMVSALVS